MMLKCYSVLLLLLISRVANNVGKQRWWALASSADGLKLVAAAYGAGIYTGAPLAVLAVDFTTYWNYWWRKLSYVFSSSS